MIEAILKKALDGERINGEEALDVLQENKDDLDVNFGHDQKIQNC